MQLCIATLSAPLPKQPRTLPPSTSQYRFQAPSDQYLSIQIPREFSLNLFLPDERDRGPLDWRDASIPLRLVETMCQVP